MRGSLRGKRRIHGAKERANAPVGAGLARHGVRREGPMRGKPRIYEMRGSLHGKRRIHGPRERSIAPVGAGLARHGASPGRPHAGQAPHLRNARLPAWQAPHSRGKRAGKRPRRCRACPARASPGKPHAGQAPHPRNARLPTRQAPHSRDMRAGKRPRRCRACPARGFTGKAPMRGKPRIHEMRAPAGKPRIHGEHAVPWRCVSPLAPGRHCLNAGARPFHAQRAATRRTGRCTCPPLSRGRPTHCRALSARHRRRHAHTQA